MGRTLFAMSFWLVTSQGLGGAPGSGLGAGDADGRQRMGLGAGSAEFPVAVLSGSPVLRVVAHIRFVLLLCFALLLFLTINTVSESQSEGCPAHGPDVHGSQAMRSWASGPRPGLNSEAKRTHAFVIKKSQGWPLESWRYGKAKRIPELHFGVTQF